MTSLPDSELEAIEHGAKDWPAHAREGSLVLRLVAALRAERAGRAGYVATMVKTLADLGRETVTLEERCGKLERDNASLLRLRNAAVRCLEGRDMQDRRTMGDAESRPSGSVNGGTILAPRWWWILRAAWEDSWSVLGHRNGEEDLR